jgi:hypothetical protein
MTQIMKPAHQVNALKLTELLDCIEVEFDKISRVDALAALTRIHDPFAGAVQMRPSAIARNGYVSRSITSIVQSSWAGSSPQNLCMEAKTSWMGSDPTMS